MLAPHLIGYTAVMAPISIVIVVLAAVLLPGDALGGPPVRVPRDSALVVNGVVRPASGGASSVAPPAPRATEAPGARACVSRTVPDPDGRPLWLPGEWCWTGGESVWVPGHWVW